MDQLPEELLCRILQPLTRNTLRNVSLVNKQFARLVAPNLYSDIFLSSGERSVEADSSKQFRLFRKLLRTLDKNSDLGLNVKHLRIGDWQSNSPEAAEEDVAHVSATDRKQIQKSMPFLAHCPDEYQYQFEFDIEKPTQDAMTAAILSFLPSLKSLSFKMDHWSHEGFEADWEGIMDYGHIHFHQTRTFRLIELSTTLDEFGFPLFKHLTDVFLDDNCFGDGTTEGWNFRLISIFMKLPS